jgi:adenylate kinase family enzyme
MIDYSRITERIRFFLYAADYNEGNTIANTQDGTWVLNILEEEYEITHERIAELLTLMENGSWISGVPCSQPVENEWSRATTEYVLMDQFPRILCHLRGVALH